MDMKRTTAQSSAGYHRLDSLMWCPREFFFAEVLKVRPRIDRPPLALGSAIHAGLVAHYLGNHWSEGLEGADPSWSYKVPEAKKILEKYVEFYPTETFAVIAVEQELKIEIDGLPFTRRVDLLLYDRVGRVVRGMDHKTAARMGERLKSIKVDGSLFSQDIIGAMVVPSWFGCEWGGMILNLIGTGKKIEFQRHELTFPSQVLSDAMRSITHWTHEAHFWSTQKGTNPWDVPQTFHCQRPWGRCSYDDLCMHGVSAMSGYVVKEV